MRALSIRQPFAELILRGIKTAEFRSRPTRFLIYASKGRSKKPGAKKPEGNLVNGSFDDGWTSLPQWMVELAEQIKLIPEDLELPTGCDRGQCSD